MPRLNEKLVENMITTTVKGDKRNGHTWAHLGRSPDRQCPGDLSKPGQHYSIRTNDDLVSLELRWPETEHDAKVVHPLARDHDWTRAQCLQEHGDGRFPIVAQAEPRVRRQTWHCPHSGIPANHEPRALHDQGAGGTATPEFEDKCTSTRPDITQK